MRFMELEVVAREDSQTRRSVKRVAHECIQRAGVRDLSLEDHRCDGGAQDDRCTRAAAITRVTNRTGSVEHCGGELVDQGGELRTAEHAYPVSALLKTMRAPLPRESEELRFPSNHAGITVTVDEEYRRGDRNQILECIEITQGGHHWAKDSNGQTRF